MMHGVFLCLPVYHFFLFALFRYHLQCLRHLYVLATKPRRLCGVNVSTNQVEPVALKYWYKVSPAPVYYNQ